MCRGTPLLLLGAAQEPPPPGFAGVIAQPVESGPARAAIEQWTGPLAEAAFRNPDDAHYRLVRLVGRTRAHGMLARLAEHLREALAALEHGRPAAALAHRFAGVAGLYGFAELARCWQMVELDEHPDLAGVRATTQGVLDQLDASLP